MNKKVVKFAACCLTGTIILSSQGILANAADITNQLPSAGLEAVLNDCYTASADVSIIEYLTATVNSEYKDLAISKVTDYVNIRSAANEESEAVGKLYANSAAKVIGEEGDWIQVESGSVTGFIKSDYLATGEEAEQLAEQVGKKVATVNAETLKVREEASTEASVQTLVPIGEELDVNELKEGWVGVAASDGTTGFVSEDYVEIKTEFKYAESKAEEEARLAAEEAARQAEIARQEAERRAERERQEAANAARNNSSSNSTSNNSSSSSSKKSQSTESAPAESAPSAPASKNGQAVANYACQFVGNPYKWGGSSLTSGADCSGFVMAVYAKFGVSLPHSSASMRSVGTGVSYSQAQPGDIICYSGHVGIYIGNGTIVNALNQASGITYTSATYKGIITVRRIF